METRSTAAEFFSLTKVGFLSSIVLELTSLALEMKSLLGALWKRCRILVASKFFCLDK